MFAFILMPFDVAFDDVYKLGIKETNYGDSALNYSFGPFGLSGYCGQRLARRAD